MKEVKEERNFHFYTVTKLRIRLPLLLAVMFLVPRNPKFCSSKHKIFPQEWSLFTPAERNS